MRSWGCWLPVLVGCFVRLQSRYEVLQLVGLVSVVEGLVEGGGMLPRVLFA